MAEGRWRYNRGVRILAWLGLVAVWPGWGGESLEAIFQRAAEALKRGDYVAAERGFAEVLKAQPNHVGALANLGTAHSRMGRLSTAARAYQAALAQAPNEPGLLLNLALVYLKQQEFAKAKPLVEAVDRSRLGSAQTKELLATCEIHLGGPEKALKMLEGMPGTASVVYLRGLAYLKLNEREKANAAFAELLGKAATPAQAHYLLGKAYLENGLIDEAQQSLKKALELDGKLLAARLELAKSYLAARNYAAAETELRGLVKAMPHDPEPAYYLAALLVVDNRGEVALPVLEKLVKVQPDSWSTQYYLGRAYFQTGNYAGAASRLEEAAKLNGKEGAIWYQLARAYQSAGREADAARAREEVKKLRQQAVEDERRLLTGPMW